MSIEQLAVTTLVRLYHSAAKSRLGWDNLPREISRCQRTAEGRTWSTGKLGAGINCAKLAICARSRAHGRFSAVAYALHWQNLRRSSTIMTGENSANVAKLAINVTAEFPPT